MCWKGRVHIDFGQFLAWRHFVWVFSGVFRLFVACLVTLISMSEHGLVTKNTVLGKIFRVDSLF